jgi:Ca-activated chloride channel homolog
MVNVSFTVTDAAGRFVRNLRPTDIRILEDGIEQHIASFTGLEELPGGDAEQSPGDNSVFVLLSSSNAMYDDFMHASDTVADFVRGISSRHAVAVYTFSRNLYRAAPLSHDAFERVSAIRSNVIGDDTAVFNSLLLTVRDAAKVPGNKTVVLLSNGPDNASIVSPDDVARVAQEEGIPINVVYTKRADELTDLVLRRLAASTGGRTLFAQTWDEQKAAFHSIQNELMNSYTLAYYPRPSDNSRFRRIEIEVVSDTGKRYRIRSRPGYKPGVNRPAAPPCANCRLAFAPPSETVQTVSLDR